MSVGRLARAAAWTAAVLALAAVATGLAGAALADSSSDGSQYQTQSSLDPKDIPAGKVVYAPSKADTTGHQVVTLSPPQLVQPAPPGTRFRVAIQLINYGTTAESLYVHTENLAAATSPESFARPAGTTNGAAQWMRPEVTSFRIGPAQQARFAVDVDVPKSAAPGVHAIAVVVSHELATPAISTQNGARVAVNASLASEFLLLVSGSVTDNVRLSHPHGPRIVWHGQHPTFTALYENSGQSLGQGTPTFSTGTFSGVASTDIKLDPVMALPGGTRLLSVKWNDTPWLGWFHPKMFVTCGCGQPGATRSVSFPTVFVLPPWWVLVLLALAIILPPIRSTILWRRRKQELLDAADARRAEREAAHDDDELYPGQHRGR
jgi:hypothetical protein